MLAHGIGKVVWAVQHGLGVPIFLCPPEVGQASGLRRFWPLLDALNDLSMVIVFLGQPRSLLPRLIILKSLGPIYILEKSVNVSSFNRLKNSVPQSNQQRCQ